MPDQPQAPQTEQNQTASAPPPGWKSSEFIGISTFLSVGGADVIKTLIDKQGNSTTTIVCMTVAVCVFAVCRTFLKVKHME